MLFLGLSESRLSSPRKVLVLNRAYVETQTEIAGLDDLLSWSHSHEPIDNDSDSEPPLIMPEQLQLIYNGNPDEDGFDVNECLFCQGSENKKGRNLLSLGNDAIKSLEQTLPEFMNLKSECYIFPVFFVIGRLLKDDPGQLLRSKQFKYHRYCKNRFNPSELERAKKRKIDDSSTVHEIAEERDESEPSDRSTRSSVSGGPERFSKTCMFCEEAEDVKYNPRLSKTFKFKLRAAASKNRDNKYAIKFTEDIVQKVIAYNSACF